jgi:hypothetical protein
VVTLPGCPMGTTVATSTTGVVEGRIVKNARIGYDVCLTAYGATTHLVAAAGTLGGYAADVQKFTNGSYFEADDLGHLFVLANPGQLPGVTVLCRTEAHSVRSPALPSTRARRPSGSR